MALFFNLLLTVSKNFALPFIGRRSGYQEMILEPQVSVLLLHNLEGKNNTAVSFTLCSTEIDNFISNSIHSISLLFSSSLFFFLSLSHSLLFSLPLLFLVLILGCGFVFVFLLPLRGQDLSVSVYLRRVHVGIFLGTFNN